MKIIRTCNDVVCACEGFNALHQHTPGTWCTTNIHLICHQYTPYISPDKHLTNLKNMKIIRPCSAMVLCVNALLHWAVFYALIQHFALLHWDF